MNPFDAATKIIMSNPDFTDECVIAGTTTSVVASELSEAETLTEYGEDAGVSFFLRVEARLLPNPPKKYNKVVFHGITYKIDRIDLDSAGLVYRIYLRSLTTRSS